MGVVSITALTVLAGCGVLRHRLNRPVRPAREFWDGRIRLMSLWNEGAAFGLPLPEKVVAAGSGALLAVLLFWSRVSPLGVGLALGGGLSNLWERLRYGKVYDYLQFPRLPWRLRRYVMNLADLAIFAGAIILVFHREK